MSTGAQTWSTTAANNNSADGAVNWAEGMAPSAVNNSARAEMASAAMWIADNSGVLSTTGTTLAYTVSSRQGSTAAVDGYTIAVRFHATNDSSATLNVDGVGAKQLQLRAGTNVSSEAFLANTVWRLSYNSGSTAWVAISGRVGSGNIGTSAILYSKLQDETGGTILGNGGSTATAPAELTIGTGLVATATSISAPAFPPAASFKNLSIKTATTTTIDCAADYVTMATSGSSAFITLPCSGTINMATTGVANGLDTGALGSGTFYPIWAIAASATSTHGNFLASTSFTTPLMPSGYTYKARVGVQASKTTTGTAALHGIYQYGRRAQYAVGVAGSTALTRISAGGSGTLFSAWGSVSASSFIPQTSNVIRMVAQTIVDTAVQIIAPSTNYSVSAGSDVPPPIINVHNNLICELVLESGSFAYQSNGGDNTLDLLGWDDNI